MLSRLRSWWAELGTLHGSLSASNAPKLSSKALWGTLLIVAIVVTITIQWATIHACNMRLFKAGLLDASVRLPLAWEHAVWWHLALWGGVPLVFAVVMAVRPSTLGLLPRGGLRALGVALGYVVLVLPLLWWTGDTEPWNMRWFVLQEMPRTQAAIFNHMLVVFGFAAVVEFFFRGFILLGVQSLLYGDEAPSKNADNTALHLSVLLYCFAYLIYPWQQTLWAVGEGYVLGLIALRYRSIWPGVGVLCLEMMLRDALILST